MPDSDDDVESNSEYKSENEEEGADRHVSDGSNDEGSSYFKATDNPHNLMLLVNRVKFLANLHSEAHIFRDFAAIGSTQIARGSHFQTRKLSHGLGIAKYPIIQSTEHTRIGLTPECYEAISLELRILSHDPIRNHANIVNIIAIGWTRLDPVRAPCIPIIYLEYAHHGTLSQFLRENLVDSTGKLKLAREIGKGLQILHACGITHGDLKLDNVLVFQTANGIIQAKLSDFGSSLTTEGGAKRLKGGSPPWNAPEWHKNIAATLLPMTDVYSFGLLVWRLFINGNDPFEGQAFEDVEARKTADLMVAEASQSLENFYDEKMLLRGEIEDSARFPFYLRSVAMPRRCMQHTLLFFLPERDLGKALESLSMDSFYGSAETPTKVPEGVKITDDRPTLTFLRLFDAPNIIKTEFLNGLQRIGENPSLPPKIRGDACLQLCYANIDSFGTMQNIPSALMWAEKAARLDNILAAGLVKRLYDAAGISIPPNLRGDVVQWLSNAVQRGSVLAQEDLRQLNPEKCRLSEQQLKLLLGAAGVNGTMRAELVEALFTDLNLDSRRALYMAAGTYGKRARVWLSRSKNTLLHAGASLGVDATDFEKVMKEFDLDLDAQDKAGNTPLLLAMRCNNPPLAKILLQHGAGVSLPNKRGETPWHWLVSLNELSEIDSVTHLLSKDRSGLRANAKSRVTTEDQYSISHGGTPLHWAVERGKTALVQVLLRKGADPSASYLNMTPIDLAIVRNHPEILRTLLAANNEALNSSGVLTADKFPRPTGGVFEGYVQYATSNLPLHDRWVYRGRSWLESMRQTLSVLREFGLCSKTRTTPLFQAAFSHPYGTEVLELLVAEGYCEDVGDPGQFWNKLLGDIITLAEPVVLEFVLKRAKSYSASGRLHDPENLLLESARSLNCNTSIVEEIFKSGIDIDCSFDNGRTALMIAVGNRNFEIATYLLSRGADVNALWQHEDTGVNILFEHLVYNMDIALVPLQYLLEPLHPFHEKVPNFIVVPSQQETALHLACRTGNRIIAEYLLQKFCKKEFLDFSGHNGWTALHTATFYGHVDVVKMLCRAGADINAQIGRRDMPRRKRKTVLDFCYWTYAPEEDTLSAVHGLEFAREDVFIRRLIIAEYLKSTGARRADRKLIHRDACHRFAIYAVQEGMVRLLAHALRQLGTEYPIRQPLLDALLWFSATEKHPNVVQMLIDAGANVNQRSKNMVTPLHIAAGCSQAQIANVLIKAGADVNAQDNEDETPLTYAWEKRDVTSMRVIKGAGGATTLPRQIRDKVFRNVGIDPSILGDFTPCFNLTIKGEPLSDDEDDESSGDEPAETGLKDGEQDNPGHNDSFYGGFGALASEDGDDGGWKTTSDNSSVGYEGLHNGQQTPPLGALPLLFGDMKLSDIDSES